MTILVDSEIETAGDGVSVSTKGVQFENGFLFSDSSFDDLTVQVFGTLTATTSLFAGDCFFFFFFSSLSEIFLSEALAITLDVELVNTTFTNSLFQSNATITSTNDAFGIWVSFLISFPSRSFPFLSPISSF